MKIFIILLLFLSGCAFMNTYNTRVGELFLYKDLKDNNPQLIGELYLNKKKLIFSKAESVKLIDGDLVEQKIKLIKNLLNNINNSGYLTQIVPGEPEYSIDGKTIVSKGGYNQMAIYIEDHNFFKILNSEFGRYLIKIKFPKDQSDKK